MLNMSNKLTFLAFQTDTLSCDIEVQKQMILNNFKTKQLVKFFDNLGKWLIYLYVVLISTYENLKIVKSRNLNLSYLFKIWQFLQKFKFNNFAYIKIKNLIWPKILSTLSPKIYKNPILLKIWVKLPWINIEDSIESKLNELGTKPKV